MVVKFWHTIFMQFRISDSPTPKAKYEFMKWEKFRFGSLNFAFFIDLWQSPFFNAACQQRIFLMCIFHLTFVQTSMLYGCQKSWEGATYRNRGTECPHTWRTHWRIHGRWGRSQSPQSEEDRNHMYNSLKKGHIAGKTELYTNSVLFLVIWQYFSRKRKGHQTHQDGYPVVVEIGRCILKGLHSSREEKEGKDACESKTKENSNSVCNSW